MSAKTAKILVTVDEDRRAAATFNVRSLLRDAGASNALILKGSPPGVIEAWIPGDPRPIVAHLQRLFGQNPDRFQGTHRWTPVESWAAPDPRDLSAYAKVFQRTLGANQSWKIDVEKHSTQVSAHDLIDNISALIDQPNVSLDAPDRTLHVSVVGQRLGFAQVEQGQIFDTSEAARLVAKDKPGPWAPKD